jgi:pimeloyl-ACP methyl ester carboxylesterase
MLVLLHGGLWDEMNADRFWVAPGVLDGLTSHGLDVRAPDRLRRPSSWAAETEHLLPMLPSRPVWVVGGSNGCSVAARLAVDHPDRVAGLILAWPATAGDPMIDPRLAAELAGLDAAPAVLADLLAGDTLRGVSDAELAGLRTPVGILPALPDDPFHQRRTADALLALIPGATELPGTPEPPQAAFAAAVPLFVNTVARYIAAH